MFTDAMLEGFRTHSNPILYADTDWTDLLIKNSALQTQHNMTISGGSDRVRYFASLGIFTQKDFLRLSMKMIVALAITAITIVSIWI